MRIRDGRGCPPVPRPNSSRKPWTARRVAALLDGSAAPGGLPFRQTTAGGIRRTGDCCGTRGRTMDAEPVDTRVASAGINAPSICRRRNDVIGEPGADAHDLLV